MFLFRLGSYILIGSSCFMLLILSIAPLSANSEQIALSQGERQTYELSWEMIPVGTAKLGIKDIQKVQGEPALHFRLQLRSNAILDPLYKVRSRIDAYTDLELNRSLLYTEHNRGKDKKKARIMFDWNQKQAQYQKNGELKTPLPILPGTFDPLSAYYFFRTQELKPGLALQIPVTDGKKNFLVKVSVVDQEQITVPEGDYDSFVLKPDLTQLDGIFAQSDQPTMTLWVSAKPPHILLRMECSVFIGRIIAVLTDKQ